MLRDAAIVVQRLVSNPIVAARLMKRALERMRPGEVLRRLSGIH